MSRRRVSASWLAIPFALIGCTSDVGAPGSTPGTIALRASLTGTSVASVVIEVAAADIVPILLFNLTVVNDVATGVITVPAGSNRTLTARAYDANGVQTHAGSATITVPPGATLTASLTLNALTGTIDLEVTLGHVLVTVSPPNPSLAAGATVQLAADITDEHGIPVVAVPVWATADPGIATVDGTGLVTAVAPGQTSIAATYGGAAGHSIMSVTAGP